MFPPLFVTLLLFKSSAPTPAPSLAHSLSAFTASPEEQLSALTLPVNPPLPHLPLFGPSPPPSPSLIVVKTSVEKMESGHFQDGRDGLLPYSFTFLLLGVDGEWPLLGRQE